MPKFITLIFCFFLISFITSCETSTDEITENENIDNSDSTSDGNTDDNNSDGNTYSASESQSFFENEIDLMMDCLSLFERGDISNFFLNIYDDIDEDYSDFHEEMVESIADIEEFYYLEDIDYPSEPLNFYNLYGEYDYQKSNSQWVKVNSSNSSLTMNFPVFTYSETNNGSLYISNFEEKEVSVEDPFFIPSKLNLELSVDTEVLLDISVKDVEFDIVQDIPIPDLIDIEIFTNPFYHLINVVKINSKEFMIDYSLLNNNGCAFSVGVDVNLLSDDYENLEDKDIDEVDILIDMNSLSINIVAEPDYIFSLDDPTVTQLNNYISAKVYYQNDLIGELELYEDEYEDYSIMMVFNDGSKSTMESFENIGEDWELLVETLEGIIARYTDRM